MSRFNISIRVRLSESTSFLLVFICQLQVTLGLMMLVRLDVDHSTGCLVRTTPPYLHHDKRQTSENSHQTSSHHSFHYATNLHAKNTHQSTRRNCEPHRWRGIDIAQFGKSQYRVGSHPARTTTEPNTHSIKPNATHTDRPINYQIRHRHLNGSAKNVKKWISQTPCINPVSQETK